MFAKNKEQYFVPVMMVLKVCQPLRLSPPFGAHLAACNVMLSSHQALLDVPDVKIFAAILQGCHGDTLVKGCVETMLHNLLDQGLTDQSKALKYIGEDSPHLCI